MAAWAVALVGLWCFVADMSLHVVCMLLHVLSWLQRVAALARAFRFEAIEQLIAETQLDPRHP